MTDQNGSPARRDLGERFGGIRSVGAALLGGLIGLALAIVWVVGLDLVSREVGRWLETAFGELGVLALGGVALVLIGLVWVGLSVSRRPGPDPGSRRWLLGLIVGALIGILGVVLLVNASSGG